MKKKIFFPIILIIVLFIAAAPLQAAAFTPDAQYDVKCQKYIMVSLDTGNTVAAKNVSKKNAPAALVHLMTALVVYENVPNLDETFFASEESIVAVMDTGALGCDLKIGEEISFRDQLGRLLVGSCADAATALASEVGGTISGFVAMMNKKAAALGMNSTNYTDPSGLDDQRQFTTCEDMAKLAKEIIKNEYLYSLCCKRRYTVLTTNKTSERLLSTPNYFIDPGYNGYYYKYAVGGKTGYTSTAGRNIFATASYEGMNYFVILLGCSPTDEEGERVRYDFSSARQLFRWAFLELSYENVVELNVPLAESQVTLSLATDYVSLVPKESVYALVPNKDLDAVTYKPYVTKPLVEAPVKKGDVLGYAEIYCSGEYVGQVDLVAQADVDRNILLYLWDRFRKFITSKGFLITAAVIVAVSIAVLAVISRLRAKKRRERRRSSYRRR